MDLDQDYSSPTARTIMWNVDDTATIEMESPREVRMRHIAFED